MPSPSMMTPVAMEIVSADSDSSGSVVVVAGVGVTWTVPPSVKTSQSIG